MKKFFVCTIVLIFCGAFAESPAIYSAWRFTDEFQVFHDQSLTRDDAAKAEYGKKIRNLECKKISSLDEAVDFNKVFGYSQPVPGRIAVVVNRIDVEKTGRIQIGVGADWMIAVFVNGKNVFDTKELGGNGSAPAKKDNHAVDVAFEKGIHTVAFWISSGATTWTVAAGRIPYTKVIYPLPELKYGPYLTDVSNTGAVISFVTTEPAPCGIALRKVNEKKFRFFWSHDNFQIALNKKLHRVSVSGLEADTDYEYKLVTLVRPENKLRYFGGKYKMKTGADKFKPFKIFVTGDLQYLPDKQLAILEKYMSTKQAESSQFFISLGDSAGAFHEFEKTMFDVVLKSVLEKSRNQKNVLFVRGNHEYRGNETYLFDDYFAMKNGKSYGIYYYNNVAFIVLDCGNGQKRSMANTRHYMAYDLPEQLLQEQREYLSQAVKSAEYKNAKYKVVLSHCAVYGSYRTIGSYTARLVKGIIDEKDIHLWLAGHIHRYRRTVPGKAGYYGFSPFSVADKPYISGKYPYVTLVIDGPGVAKPHSGHTIEFLENGIKAESFFEDGKAFDVFELDKNGKIIKETTDADLKYYESK